MAGSLEVEVKLLVDSRGLQRLTALPVIGSALKNAPRKRIETSYYDTPDHVLEGEGLMLRLRKSDGAPLLSVKEQRGSAIARKEWERRIDGDTLQARDWRGTPVEPLLRDPGTRALLRPLFTTVVDRATFDVEYDGARIEVSFDRGEIKHDGREIPVSELELELKRGRADAVFNLARELADHAPLHLGLISKGERGHLLNRGEWGTPRPASRPQLIETSSLRDGIQIICRTCLKDFMMNESALANGYLEEAVHKARISVRRLRSALSLFETVIADKDFPRLKEEIGWLWDVSGPARDLDVTSGDLEDEKNDGDLPAGAVTLIELVETRRDAARQQLLAAIASDRARLLFIDLARWIENGEWTHKDGGELREPIMPVAGRLLEKRLNKLKKRARKLTKAKPRERHRIRIAAKKLRYMCEFFESIVKVGDARRNYDRLTDLLEKLQKGLGRLQDRDARKMLLRDVAQEARASLHVRPQVPLGAAVKALSSHGPKDAKLLRKLKKSSDKLAASQGFWN